MDKEFNKRVFETFPDTVWTGEMPSLAPKPASKVRRMSLIRLAVPTLAAACLLIAAITLFRPSPGTKDAPVAQQPLQSAVVYTVNDAVRANLVLPDSTSVTLNCGSKLTLAQDFGKGTRTVYLDGEGLFDVQRNRAVPFIIQTPQGNQVKVTGTKFNLSCYSDNGKFDLTLLQGSVEVTTPKKEVLEMAPADQLIMKDGFLNVSRTSTPETSLEWTEGILRFDHTSMREALSKIEKWYGVQVVVEDESVYRNSLTGVFRSEPLEDVLHLICLSSRLRYTLQDKTVSLRPVK